MIKKFDTQLLPPSPDFNQEMRLWYGGLTSVAGVDEAGRGALAGPVVAGAIVFPSDPTLAHQLKGLRDSKKTLPKQRDEWALRIIDLAEGYGIGFAWPDEIDAIGIVPATRLAMMRALELFSIPPQHLLIDYLALPDCSVVQTSLVKGDEISISIAAASILAKVGRDIYMSDMDGIFSGYGFASNKGYGTMSHREAISHLGFCPIHRKTFEIRSKKD